MRFASTFGILRHIPRAVVIGMLAPFPNMWFSVGDQVGKAGRLLSGCETLIMYAVQLLALQLYGISPAPPFMVAGHNGFDRCGRARAGSGERRCAVPPTFLILDCVHHRRGRWCHTTGTFPLAEVLSGVFDARPGAFR